MDIVDQDKFLKDFTCVKCQMVPRRGSLYHCSIGHNICQSCYQQLAGGDNDEKEDEDYDEENGTSKTTCPQCRSQYIILDGDLPQKNFTADAFLDNLKLKCRYKLV